MQIIAADAAWQMERASWRAIENSVVDARSNRIKLCTYIDYGTYDGVDLRVMTRNFWKRLGERAPELEALGDEHAVQVLVKELVERQPVEQQLGVQKILHSKQAVAMLIEVDGEMCMLVGYVASLLVGLDRSTGGGDTRCIDAPRPGIAGGKRVFCPSRASYRE